MRNNVLPFLASVLALITLTVGWFGIPLGFVFGVVNHDMRIILAPIVAYWITSIGYSIVYRYL